MAFTPREHPTAPDRRRLLQGAACSAIGLAGAVGSRVATGATPRPAPRAESPLVGVDPALVASGLTQRWAQAMRRDLGWAARWTPLPSGAVLRQLEQGDIDLGLFLSHPLAAELAKEGLIHDQRVLARTDVLLVGPTDDVAGIRGEADPTRALRQVLSADAAGAARWQPPAADSALASLVAAFTAQAGLARATSARRAAHTSAVAYRLTTHAEWLAERPPQGTRIWLQGGPGMTLACEMARPFRAQHPGARLLVQWLQSPLGRQAVRHGASGWQPPAAKVNG